MGKVIIMGLGLQGGGVSSAAFFARLGCQVTVTDLKKKDDLKVSLKKLKKNKNIKYILGRHRPSDFKTANLIIRNPAVSNDNKYLTTARQSNIPVHTDVSWFLSEIRNTKYEIRNSIIGITGTKGKSTTAALLQHVLTKCGQKSLLAGNIRKSPLDFLKIINSKFQILDSKFLILELSSWQLESLAEHKLAPHIALITNILPDHLNSYKNFNEYKKAKILIYKYQTADDFLFLNNNDPVSQKLSQQTKIQSRVIWYKEKGSNPLRQSREPYHPNNRQAVLAISKHLNLNEKSVQKAIKTFAGLAGRLEYVRSVKGVKYYNDTCATQPDATIYAIERLKKQIRKGKNKIVLIAGGEDKNLNYDKLACVIVQNVKNLILFKGSASNKIIKKLKQFNNRTIEQYNNITSMEHAVLIAKKQSKAGDIVLLSPAAASFGLFKHEFDRGKQFSREVLCNIN